MTIHPTHLTTNLSYLGQKPLTGLTASWLVKIAINKAVLLTA
ncbi:hypothetical protein [Shewanella xiamenensis]|nr:hypothetical protein [Shewanella xiamenensis]